MSQSISIESLAGILKDAANRWSQHTDELQKLDAIVGDGDIGVTVELGSKAIVDYLTNQTEEDVGKMLMKCAMQVNKSSPSTFGTLLASAFMEAGKVTLGKKEIVFKDLLIIGWAAIDGIKKLGKAEVGDKTMLDAMVPAVNAFHKKLLEGNSDEDAIEEAIRAAKAGAEATAKMKAKFGRASYRQDGGIGVQDAGATAVYYLIRSFCLSLITNKDRDVC